MHHGNDPDAVREFNEAFAAGEAAKAQSLIEQLGPTGRFPEGRLNGNDEGEIRFAIRSCGGKLIMDFGTPVAWIGMGRSQAIHLIKILQEHADAL